MFRLTPRTLMQSLPGLWNRLRSNIDNILILMRIRSPKMVTTEARNTSGASRGKSTPQNLPNGDIKSELFRQVEGSLIQYVGKVCRYYDEHAIAHERRYNDRINECDELRTEKAILQSRIDHIEKERDDALRRLREFQAEHMHTAGRKRLVPVNGKIEGDFEKIQKQVFNVVRMRLREREVGEQEIENLLAHKPFQDHANGLMLGQDASQESRITPITLFGPLGGVEKKKLALWVIQGVIHSILRKSIDRHGPPGLGQSEWEVINKISTAIATTSGENSKAAYEWRAETFRKLVDWRDYVSRLRSEDKEAYMDDYPVFREMEQSSIAFRKQTERLIYTVLEPICSLQTPGGQNFFNQISDIVDGFIRFGILIGEQMSTYELRMDIDGERTNDFEPAPDGLETPVSKADALFCALPALIRISNEEGELEDYEPLLVTGKMYLWSSFSELSGFAIGGGGNNTIAEPTAAVHSSLYTSGGPMEGIETGNFGENISNNQGMPQQQVGTGQGMQGDLGYGTTVNPNKGADTLPAALQSMTELSETSSEQELTTLQATETDLTSIEIADATPLVTDLERQTKNSTRVPDAQPIQPAINRTSGNPNQKPTAAEAPEFHSEEASPSPGSQRMSENLQLKTHLSPEASIHNSPTRSHQGPGEAEAEHLQNPATPLVTPIQNPVTIAPGPQQTIMEASAPPPQVQSPQSEIEDDLAMEAPSVSLPEENQSEVTEVSCQIQPSPTVSATLTSATSPEPISSKVEEPLRNEGGAGFIGDAQNLVTSQATLTEEVQAVDTRTGPPLSVQ
ncbi:hypothetical protein ABW19_dt0204659 [Dactylella cylindrospora]|nr:hypothetical protein ABW19_dt0204659 [Dactylella cylindrospora]